MPRVNVVGTTLVNQPGNGLKKRRDAYSPNITTYMTLILKSDGAKASPNKSIELIDYRGVLDSVPEPMYFNPEDDPFIHIKVHSNVITLTVGVFLLVCIHYKTASLVWHCTRGSAPVIFTLTRVVSRRTCL